MKFGEKLREVRKERGLTQEELANQVSEKFGYPCYRSNITKWENGTHTPGVSTISNLAEVLGVTVDYMIGTEANESESLAEALKNRPFLRMLMKQLLAEDDSKVKAMCTLVGIDTDPKSKA